MQYDLSPLKDCIFLESQLVDNLVDLGARKKQAIILGELPGLNEIMHEENQLAQVLKQTEARRQGESINLARELGMDEEAPTALSLINALREAGTPDTEKLRASVEDLTMSLGRLQDINRANAVLLEQSLSFVENMQTLLTRQRETTYSAGGILNDSPARSLLDKRI